MQLFPVTTRVLKPPHDNLYTALDESLHDIQERDIVVITSKVVSVRIEERDKQELIAEEAELIWRIPERKNPITIAHHTIIGAAGVDESNGNGYYTLLPKNPFASAQEIQEYLREKYGIKELGVIITDSHSAPFRYGAMSISIGCWGFEPIISHIGKQDLFGRVVEYSKTNVADALSASATLVSGECAEASPIVIVRDVPNICFTNEKPEQELFVPYEEDMFKVLFEKFARRKD